MNPYPRMTEAKREEWQASWMRNHVLHNGYWIRTQERPLRDGVRNALAMMVVATVVVLLLNALL